MISAKEIAYFCEVARCENLSRASERLGVAQPSLSHAMRKLEDNLGVVLFIRSKTGVCLTQAGKQLLLHSMEMQQFWQDVKAKVSQSHTDVVGCYTVGCHPSVGFSHIQSTISKIIRNNSNIELNLCFDLSRKITEQVIDMRIDIGVVVNPVKHPNLVIIKLYDDHMGVWHNFTKKELYNKSHAMICDPSLTQTAVLVKKLKKHCPDVLINRTINSAHLELNAKLAAEKTGLAILPEAIAKNISDELKLLENSPTFKDEICIICRPESKNVRAIQVIIQALKKTS